MMPDWKQYGVKISKEDAPLPGSSSTNQQQKRKLDIVEPMTKTTEGCNDAAQSKPRPATPMASQVLYKAPPTQLAGSTAGFIVVHDEQQHGVEQKQEQQQEVVGEAEGAVKNDSDVAQVEVQPSPATTLSANLSATEDSSTVQYEGQASAAEPTSNAEQEDDETTQEPQPAEEPTEEFSRHTPPQVDTPADESPHEITLAMIEQAWTSHSIPTSFIERQEWLAAGWVDPEDWNQSPTEDQMAAWRRRGWKTQEDYDQYEAWAAAGWRFD